MACPFFMPEHPLGAEGRAPLGDCFHGACHADPGQPFEPPAARQDELCNFGYARGRCERFQGSADAVRFSTAGEGRLIWVLEKDHAPLEHGVLEYTDDGFVSAPGSPVLAAQAGAFLRTYLRARAAPQNL